jgi:hypothetical protein
MHTHDISTLERLRTTLGKMHPIEESEVTFTGVGKDHMGGPRFCWRFFRPNPDTFRRLAEAVSNFSGNLYWIVYASGSLSCIAPSEYGPGSSFYSPVEEKRPLDHMNRQGSLNEEFVAAALNEVPALCAHIEGALGLENRPTKVFDPASVAQQGPPSPNVELTDFVEPGMTWIVKNPDQFAKSVHAESEANKLLHFGVTLQEWHLIYSQLSGASEEKQGGSGTFAGYPMLSRIEPYEGAIFQRREIDPLLNECLRARKSTSAVLSRRGLDKLILICYWARKLHYGLYLMGP